MNTDEKRRIVIFGLGEIAELADFYFTHDSGFDVVGFTVDQSFLKQQEFRGRPVVPFENVAETWPPEHFGLFVSVGYTKLNAVRREKVNAARAKGYQLVSYLSSRATVFPGFELGENCFILEDNTIQPFAKVGANVTLWSGNHIGHHSVIEDDVFIASHVVVSGGARMFEDDQVKHLGIAQDVPNAENRHIRLVGQPVTLSRTPSKMAARPPEFGEQTDEVLAEFGFAADEIAELRQAKVV